MTWWDFFRDYVGGLKSLTTLIFPGLGIGRAR